MPNYHLSIKIFSRGSGASAIAKAAYRAAERIKSEYDGQTHDYTRKDGVIHKEILLPDHAPPEYASRAALWNAVEKSERYKAAQLAREVEVSLPVELNAEQNISLARRFAKEVFVSAGMCADLCVHDTNRTNPHFHLMLTMRPIEQDGMWGPKSRTIGGKKVPTVDWNDSRNAEYWRRAWAAYLNTALRINGCEAAVDHRSYERQGVDLLPTAHLGPAASRMERRGVATEIGDRNREVAAANQQMRQLRARISRLEAWLVGGTADAEPLALSEVITNILNRRDRSGLSNLKDASKTHAFLVSNNIYDLAGLERKVRSMHSKAQAIREDLKPVERRLRTLDDHIRQAGIYLNNKGNTARTESEEILFKASKKYLDEHLNGHKLNLKAWKAQHKGMSAEKERLYSEYYPLKEETRKVEQIKRSIEGIIREGTLEMEQPRKNKERS